MACFGGVVCLVLIIYWYLCLRRKLAAKAGVQGYSHEEGSPSSC